MTRHGARHLGGARTRFSVWAPAASEVLLVLEDGRSFRLAPTTAGYHAAVISRAGPGTRYRYLLDGAGPFADPASRFQPAGVDGPSEVVESAPRIPGGFSGLPLAAQVICEIHVGTFSPAGDFAGVAAQLDDLAAAGYSAIELMPVAEFPGGRNWGYDGVFPFAVQSTYGGPSALRELVESARRRGIAVILDVVYNHLGPRGAVHGHFGPYFTDAYVTPWGEAPNLDGPGSDEVRAYFIENACYFVGELGLDGLRLDAVHALIDTSARSFVSQLAAAVHVEARRAGRFITLVAESNSNDPRLVAPPEAGGEGLDGQWDDDFHHALRVCLGLGGFPRAVDFSGMEDLARAMRDGFVLTGRYSPAFGRHHGAPLPAAAGGERLVVFAQNHDQIGNMPRSARLSTALPFAAQFPIAAAVLCSPFVPLRFMGEEYGDPAPFPYFTSHGDPELAELVRRGRAAEIGAEGHGSLADPESPQTFAAARPDRALAAGGEHGELLAWHTALCALRRREPALSGGDRHHVATEVDEAARTLVLRRGADPVLDAPEVIVVVQLGPDPATIEVVLGARYEVALARGLSGVAAGETLDAGREGKPAVLELSGYAAAVLVEAGGEARLGEERGDSVKAGLGATYRIQLGPAFGFDEAAALVPYLAALGVQCCYLSPIAEAVPGSGHGYDVTDPTTVRAELGGRDAFFHLVDALERAALGLVLDIVPNHLSTWPAGPWWGDVLAKGRDSPYAGVFDIDWAAGTAPGHETVALPLLDASLEESLASGAIHLAARTGGTVLVIGEVDLPLAGPVRADADPREVLAAQHYRLVDWHDAGARNYRRFFDIDGLVGVRVEDDAVFSRTHALLGELVAAGAVSALRVDHIDGLADPAAYLERLAGLTGGLPVVVEKILTGDERLPGGWRCRGTTGYEVLDDISGALVDPEGLEQLAASARAAGEPAPADAISAGKRLVATERFGRELEMVAARLGVAPAAIVDTAVRLPVYRTYLRPGVPPRPEDVVTIEGATAGALGDVLLAPQARAATMRLQQTTGAVTAKGVEDTAWFRLSGRAAFCEVGGDPARDRRGGAERLAARAAERGAAGLAPLVPGTTHDTKRSADSRARLLALAERPTEFAAGLERFAACFAGPVPDAFERRFLAQSVLAVLPLADEGWVDLADRLEGFIVKAAREAKRRTSWTDPDQGYERALGSAARAAVASRGALVRDAFGDLVDDVARLGATIALSQVLCRSAVPGFPDCYRGEESWFLALTDPDNRRLPDHATLGATLAGLGDPGALDLAALRRSWRDGRVKLHVTSRALEARRSAAGAFDPATPLTPIPGRGAHGENLLAFSRRAGSSVAVALCTRLPGRLAAGPDDLPVGEPAWGETTIRLPTGTASVLRDAFTGREHRVTGEIALASLLGELPVALLVGA